MYSWNSHGQMTGISKFLRASSNVGATWTGRETVHPSPLANCSVNIDKVSENVGGGSFRHCIVSTFRRQLGSLLKRHHQPDRRMGGAKHSPQDRASIGTLTDGRPRGRTIELRTRPLRRDQHALSPGMAAAAVAPVANVWFATIVNALSGPSAEGRQCLQTPWRRHFIAEFQPGRHAPRYVCTQRAALRRRSAAGGASSHGYQGPCRIAWSAQFRSILPVVDTPILRLILAAISEFASWTLPN